MERRGFRSRLGINNGQIVDKVSKDGRKSLDPFIDIVASDEEAGIGGVFSLWTSDVVGGSKHFATGRLLIVSSLGK